ncbi:MAG TPA: phosphotransferase family protein [Pyrinomonadaceae bacterium]|nr:phosphotransferase family protein [Pyrinomonadaceae bacterium]
MSDTKPIRHGEELDAKNLQTFLREKLDVKIGEIEISQFPGGSSNLTYCVKIGADEYVLRRPPFGNQVKSAHDMSREFNVLSKLSAVYKPAPKPLIYCDDETIIGSEFYLMERRKGLIIRGKSPTAETRALASGQSETLETSQDLRKKVVESFIENLANLHGLDYRKIGLENLGKPEGYAERQVTGWTKRYFNAKTDEHFELEKSIEWLNSNIPNSNGASLIHNDYKFDNVMLNPNDLTEIIAVLDWEMTTIGEPLMDLGSSLAYWMSKENGETMLSMPFNPRVLMENISRQELVEIYEEKSGKKVSDIVFYYVFGTFKLAVIAQQIYFRYTKGFTKDKRFATFNYFVNSLGKIALNAIEKQKI